MKRFLASAFAFALPVMVFGQASTIGNNVTDILVFIGKTVSYLGPVLVGLAILAFFWSLIRFLFEKDKTPESKSYLIWSVVILFVMVSIWGIVKFFQTTLGVGSEISAPVPRVQVVPFGSQ